MKKKRSNSAKSLYTKYQTLAKEIDRAISTNEIANWTYQKVQYSIARLLHWARLMRQKGLQIGISATLFLGAVSAFSQETDLIRECDSNPFEQILEDMPLGDMDFEYANPIIGDFDGDFDDDLLVILVPEMEDPMFYYFENTPSGLQFSDGMDGITDIFNDVDLATAPLEILFGLTFGDIDCDQDLDLVVGEKEDGKTFYFEMTSEGLQIPDNEDDIPFIQTNGFENEDSGAIARFGNLDDDCEDEMILVSGLKGGDLDIAVFDQLEGEYIKNDQLTTELKDLDGVFPAYFVNLNGEGTDEMVGLDIDEGSAGLFYQLVDGEWEEVTDEDPDPLFALLAEVNGTDDELFLNFIFGDLDNDGFLNLYVGEKNNETEIIFCYEIDVPTVDPCVKIPAMNHWALFILSLILTCMSVVLLGRFRSVFKNPYQ